METIKHKDFLRHITVIKSFTSKGICFKEGQVLDQIMTPIGSRRNWNTIYIDYNGTELGIDIKNIRM